MIAPAVKTNPTRQSKFIYIYIYIYIYIDMYPSMHPKWSFKLIPKNIYQEPHFQFHHSRSKYKKKITTGLINL